MTLAVIAAACLVAAASAQAQSAEKYPEKPVKIAVRSDPSPRSGEGGNAMRSVALPGGG